MIFFTDYVNLPKQRALSLCVNYYYKSDINTKSLIVINSSPFLLVFEFRITRREL